MARREEWLAAGRAALVTDGAPGVRIDKLAARLGATKGSFYHHFDGARGFRLALLADVADTHTRRFTAIVDAAGGTARERLEHLVELVLAEPTDRGDPAARPGALEVAVRAWAQQDADVREAQERIDRMRADYLRDLWASWAVETGADPDATDPEAAAWLLHTVVVGGHHLVPALRASQLRRVFALALRLAPEAVPPPSPPPSRPPSPPPDPTELP